VETCCCFISKRVKTKQDLSGLQQILPYELYELCRLLVPPALRGSPENMKSNETQSANRNLLTTEISIASAANTLQENVISGLISKKWWIDVICIVAVSSMLLLLLWGDFKMRIVWKAPGDEEEYTQHLCVKKRGSPLFVVVFDFSWRTDKMPGISMPGSVNYNWYSECLLVLVN